MSTLEYAIENPHFHSQYQTVANRVARLKRREKLMPPITRRMHSMQQARDNIQAKLVDGVENHIGTDDTGPHFSGHIPLVYAIEVDGIHYIVGELWEREGERRTPRRITRKETAYDPNGPGGLDFSATRMFNLLDRSIKRKMDRCARSI